MQVRGRGVRLEVGILIYLLSINLPQPLNLSPPITYNLRPPNLSPMIPIGQPVPDISRFQVYHNDEIEKKKKLSDYRGK